MKQVDIRVTGKVQGVWFRAETLKLAQKLGICGWIQNNNDGSVSVCGQGDENQLKQLVAWCQNGPEMAQVDTLKDRWSDISPAAYLKDFIIRKMEPN